MGLRNWFASLDADRIFSYKTVRVVKILDRRLGLLHYSVLFLIFLYIVGYTIIYEKRYLQLEKPEGSVRMSLMKPRSPMAMEDLPYCLQTAPTIRNFTNFPCEYWDESLVQYPLTEETAILGATRVAMQNMSLDCHWEDPQCRYKPQGAVKNVYVGDIEHFTLMLDHTIYATNLGVQRNAQAMPGSLKDISGNVVETKGINTVGRRGKLDIVELGLLLKVAGIDSLDIDSEVKNTRLSIEKSMRYTGIIILLTIEYSNRISYDTNDIRYTITARHIKNTEYKAMEKLKSGTNSENIQEWDRHGIRILIKQRGEIGIFDFQALLLSLVAGSGLIALSTLLIDILACSFMPEKEVYFRYKYKETVDFSDLRDGLIGPEEDETLRELYHSRSRNSVDSSTPLRHAEGDSLM
eukprot:Nk52_evm24s2209 gene=Nk52_evmTU24s2209